MVIFASPRISGIVSVAETISRRSRSAACLAAASSRSDFAAAASATSASCSAVAARSTRATYPAASTAATRPSTSTRAGSKRTVADSDARLTLASSTPSTLFRKRVIRFTHEAQVIPSIGNETISMGVGVDIVAISRRLRQPRP
jgi:hypothetical protein